MDDQIVFVLALAFIAETVIAIICAWDMRRIYGRRLVDSLLWQRLVEANTRTVIAGVILLVIGVYSLVREELGWPPIPRPWGTIGLLLALALLMSGPIMDWWTLRRIRAGDET